MAINSTMLEVYNSNMENAEGKCFYKSLITESDGAKCQPMLAHRFKVSGSVTTRVSKKESLTTIQKSAIIDHIVDKNHVIGWGGC